MPLTKFQLRRLIKLGIDESSAKELSKVEAFEMISKLVGYTK